MLGLPIMFSPFIISFIGWQFYKKHFDINKQKWWEWCLFWPWLIIK